MKRMISLTALTLAIVVAATPASAQTMRPALNTFASDFQTIPVMGNTPGVGATFQTYVALLNPTPSSFAVQVALYDNFGAKRDASITLAAGELKTYENFLDEVFHYVGGGAVTFRSPDSANRFIITVEVRTSGTRFSTSIPALEFAGSSSRSFAAGISVNSSTRTNIGCFNQSSAPNSVTATVYDSAKQVVGTVSLNLEANAWSQAGVPSIVTNGYVQFEPTEAAVCYAVVVDNSTADGRFISAAEYRP